MKVAAFGRTHWLLNSILALSEQGNEIVLVGTCPAAPEYKATERDFEELARELSCPFFCDANINRPSYSQLARESGAEVAISVNWIGLIGQKMLDVFAHGLLNAHAGDLPKYRGNACPNWAILNGEEEVVLTIHQMSVDLDAGPVVLKREFPLTEETYIADVYRFVETNIPEMFGEALAGLANGSLSPVPQSDAAEDSLRCFPRLPRDGEMDWTKSAADLARLVRASADPFAGAYSFMDDEKVIVWRARSGRLPFPYLSVPGQVVHRDEKSGEVSVATGEGILVLQESENAEGRGRAADIVRTMRARFGMDVGKRLSALEKRLAELEGNLRQSE